MTNQPTDTYAYTLQVELNPRHEGVWQWAIRQLGKMIQRSDCDYPSKARAKSHDMGEIEELLSGGDCGRF